MATANPPPGALAVDNHNGSDPFVSGSHDAQRQRYAAFDNSQFSLYLNGSPAQAKRALQAHLAETTRRLQETSHLGNSLVQQRKELEEKLQEVEQQQQQSDIGPELRQRLAELEKEFNEVGRETARAFLPKSRVPSGETDTASGASVYSSEAQHSPTKVSVPSRKQRNQQPSRINDIALATEISTSLLSQLKDLQAVLLEKDEALKAADLDRSQLEIEVEGLSQRLRTLDESESRLKDVNWNLETQVRESEVQFKSASDKEHRLNHALNLIRSEKATLEREMEDLRQQHAKLNDDHINKSKQSETELASLRRNVTMTETEKNALQRKVEDLANQNQELAKAVAYRMKIDDQVAAEDTSPDDGGEERETQTPEHSPPPSPSKATPRHGMLESETLKHSLQHAHRMIQQLKNNIHREKTEKIELKRMLQDARDELETNRGPLNAPGSAGKRRKTDKDVFKKPVRPDRLGALRSGTHEIIEDDEEWEEQEGMQNTPSRRARPADHVPGAFTSGFASAADTSANEEFETANETSDAAFETANERDGTTTETDAFMTGAETLDGESSEELTETEADSSQLTKRQSRSSLPRGRHQDSYESTASISGDEYDVPDIRTPIQNQHPRFRLKAKQGSARLSTPRSSRDLFAATPPIAKDSPASFASNSRENTPAQGKSLFAELEDLSGDEDGSSVGEGTPSRSSVLFSPDSSPEATKRSVADKSPLQVKAVKPTMVDSGMMTESEPLPRIDLSAIKFQGTQPQAPKPANLQVSSLSAHDTSPLAPQKPSLLVSSLTAQETIPKVVQPPTLNISSVSGHATAPQAPLVLPLTMSSLSMHESAPKSAHVPLLDYSSLSSHDTSPQAARSIPLDMSSVSSHHTEPRSVVSPVIGMSGFTSHETHPVAPVERDPVAPALGMSSISQQEREPKEGLASKALAPAAAALVASGIYAHSLSPSEPSDEGSRDLAAPSSRGGDVQGLPSQVPLQMSNLFAHSTEPTSPPTPRWPTLSTMSSQATEPFSAKRVAPQLSELRSHTTEPIAPRKQPLQVSALSSWSTEPAAPRQPILQMSSLSSRSTEPQVQKAKAHEFSTHVYQSSAPIAPRHPTLALSSTVSSQVSEPIEPLKSAPKLSMLSALDTEPVAPRKQLLREANITSQHTQPIERAVTPPSQHRFSDVTILQDTQPESPTIPSFLPTPSRPSTATRVQVPLLTLSTVTSQGTDPSVPSRPVTAHRTGPVPSLTATGSSQTEQSQPGTDRSNAEVGRVPLASISSNALPKTPQTPVADEGTQTMVSAAQIDKLLLARSQRYSAVGVSSDVEKSMSLPPSPSRRLSNEGRTPRRPGSSGSMRSRAASPPPLPLDHKEVIAAAAKGLPPVSPGLMGPPTMPASAYKKRPQTPSIRTGNATATPKTGGTTPRPRRHSQRGDARSGASSPISRRSSLSSFTSEVDQRFNIQGGPSFTPSGLPAGATDPRMIQAITQTMIGEYLWKYTRKTGREGLSENRHRRFFWIHPYTRTLYWSDRDPQTAGKTELKGKSVAIESVREVEDNNPLPPGLHQKSLLVITPGRSIKFTATTGQRHETWFNALNYLCQRIDESGQTEQKPAGTDEIQDEFNAGYRSSSRATGRSRASMSSYVTRRTSSPHHAQVPTLRQSTQARTAPTEQVQGSVSSRISSFIRPSSAMRGSFSSRRSRTSVQDTTMYEEPSDAKMELSRDIHDHVERDLDNMVNVRACCDGKHDVGHLHMHSLKGRHSSNNVNSRPSLIGSLSSRSQSRNESRNTSRAESRNERIRHETEMEAANYGAGG
ncbi:anucleate primary sterigmata protein-like protein A [Setomelanomma holmii]|uniref:Anucleate primary sterigmata protein-like protein A n=1 Tax=Setomelanomma holmii TaxID=210430 RepID=A0A9P4GWV7_9PLEO|nr:anucleate primary sterigmata protein-like protein A [Setomelanomma holmii]